MKGLLSRPLLKSIHLSSVFQKSFHRLNQWKSAFYIKYVYCYHAGLL
jgi:hypothetical protein